jgi:hypothetical protein
MQRQVLVNLLFALWLEFLVAQSVLITYMESRQLLLRQLHLVSRNLTLQLGRLQMAGMVQHQQQ